MLSVTGQAMAGGRTGSADGTKKVIRTVVVVRGARSPGGADHPGTIASLLPAPANLFSEPGCAVQWASPPARLVVRTTTSHQARPLHTQQRMDSISQVGDLLVPQ